MLASWPTCGPRLCSRFPATHPKGEWNTKVSSRASPVTQWLRIHLPMQAMQETWVQSLGQEDPRRRKWQSTLVFLSQKSYRHRSLAGYTPWVHKEWDMTERLNNIKYQKAGILAPVPWSWSLRQRFACRRLIKRPLVNNTCKGMRKVELSRERCWTLMQ